MKAVMFIGTFLSPRILFGAVGLLCLGSAFGDEPKGQPATEQPATGQAATDNSPAVDRKEPPIPRYPLAAARERAKLMHDIYTATLEVIHDRYFHGPRAMVPARAMEDVFSEMKRQSHTEARWISVNLKAMSIDHEPKTAFEKRAAKEIAGGKSEYELVEDGTYRRAGAIPLHGGCISCHEGFFPSNSTTPKFAGLIISIPLTNPRQ